MSDTGTVITHEVKFPPPQPRNKWEREYQAFRRLLPRLLETHRGKYVAVHDEQVVDSGEDKLAILLRAYTRYGYVPIYVGSWPSAPCRPRESPLSSREGIACSPSAVAVPEACPPSDSTTARGEIIVAPLIGCATIHPLKSRLLRPSVFPEGAVSCPHGPFAAHSSLWPPFC
jgi:Family of unknown function (DUF5678)